MKKWLKKHTSRKFYVPMSVVALFVGMDSLGAPLSLETMVCILLATGMFVLPEAVLDGVAMFKSKKKK